ncbi:MAG: hypothetical protein A2096_05635 [Spirochaetes bacterium GWF1_41_5]|nr:MAG: hypothetical protein A2096_05635 [Spirochaetes bacterium GWF1_41_5]
MNSKLNVGIVGATGWMAGALAAGVEYDENGFAPETGNGNKSGESQISALCDLNENLLKERKKKLGLDHAELFTSFDEMLKKKNLDAIIVAVPNNMHADFAVKTLAAGKHLFLEKPFATTVEDSKKLMNAALASRLTTKIDYILLHYDEQEKLSSLVKKGAFGQIASTYFSYRHPINISNSPEQVWKLKRAKTGGAIAMGTCHAVSCSVNIADSDPVLVVCKSSPPRIRNFDYHTQHDILITYENGITGLVQGNIDFAEKYDARHTVSGTEGQFDYIPQNPLSSRVMWSSKSLKRDYSADPDFANDHLDSGDVWTHKCSRSIKEFVANARAGRKDTLLGLDSANVRRIEAVIWAAEKSAAGGAMPVMPELYR